MKGGRSGGYCSSLKSSGWSEDSGANAVDRWDHGPFCSMSIVLKAGETKSLPRKSGSWTGTIGISNAPAAAQGSEAESKDTETAPVQKRCSMSDLAAWRPNDFSGFGGMSRLRNGARIWTDRNYKFSGVGSNRDSSADSTDKTYFVRGKHERYEGNGRGPASIKAPDCGSVTIHLWAMKGGRSGGYCSSLKSSGWSEDSGANAVDRWDHGPFCSMSIVLKAGETKSLPRKSGSWTGTIGISNAPAAAQGSEAESKDTETAPVQKR